MSNEKDSKKKRTRIVTPFFRLSFPNLFKMRAAFAGNEPTYNMQMLFPKDYRNSEVIKKYLDSKHVTEQNTKRDEMRDLVKSVAFKKWGNDLPGTKKNPFRWPLQDGAEKELDAYKGMIFANAKSKFKPGLIDSAKEEILNPGDLYPGCWCRATVSIFAYEIRDEQTKAVLSYGVAFGLDNVQKAWDDDSFSGKRNAKDDFEQIQLNEEGSNFRDDDNEESESEDEPITAMNF